MIYMEARNPKMNVNFRVSTYIGVKKQVPEPYHEVIIGAYFAHVQADGDELERCWEITRRPYNPNIKVFIFVGDEAKTIMVNWD